jgi:hypothetical protein
MSFGDATWSLMQVKSYRNKAPCELRLDDVRDALGCSAARGREVRLKVIKEGSCERI